MLKAGLRMLVIAFNPIEKCCEPGHELAQARVAPLHQLRHIDPLRIALHLQRLVEAKRLCVEVKVEPGEGGRMAIEKLGRLPAYHVVEYGQGYMAKHTGVHSVAGSCRWATRMPAGGEALLPKNGVDRAAVLL
jgi:hypothetical protein